MKLSMLLIFRDSELGAGAKVYLSLQQLLLRLLNLLLYSNESDASGVGVEGGEAVDL
jgi:hypothetical protein